jgi:hypothetical protein
MKTLFAITHINRDGMRTLSSANQGRNHFEKREDASARLYAILKNNSPKTIEQHYGMQAVGTFEVRPVECYDHGDATGIYFES